ATYLLNEKRSDIEQIEKRNDLSIVILPNLDDTSQDFEIQRIKSTDMPSEEQRSYDQIHQPEQTTPDFVDKSARSLEQPAIKDFLPDSPAPTKRKETSEGLMKRFWRKIIGDEAETTSKNPRPKSGKKPVKSSKQADDANKGTKNKNKSGKTTRRPNRSRNSNNENVGDQQEKPSFARRNKQGRNSRQTAKTNTAKQQTESTLIAETKTQDKPSSTTRRRSSHISRRRSGRRKPEAADISENS
ncbi:MAG: hypothetical protein V3U88_10450, partial [Methylococcales bacterium]